MKTEDIRDKIECMIVAVDERLEQNRKTIPEDALHKAFCDGFIESLEVERRDLEQLLK